MNTHLLLPTTFFLCLGVTGASIAQGASSLNTLDARVQQHLHDQHAVQSADLSSTQPVHVKVPSLKEAILPNQESSCTPVQRIQVQDQDADKGRVPSHFAWALKKAQNQLNLTLPSCMGTTSIQALMRAMQNELLQAGYVTTQVVAPEQDIDQGTLNLLIVPGRIGNIHVHDDSYFPRFTRLTALTGLAFSSGDVLNVRDIEQSMENLRHVPTAQANIDIMPVNTQDGVSDVQVSYHQGFPIRFGIGLDNAGIKATGRLQVSANLSVDHLLTANDVFYGSFLRSFKQQGDYAGDRFSQSGFLYYSIPFGYWSFTTQYSQNRYLQQVLGNGDQRYVYAGRSKELKLTLSYILHRNQTSKTTLSGSLWARHTHNMLDGTEIDVQRRHMAGWEVALEHNHQFGVALVTAGVSYKRGTGMWNSQPAPEEAWAEGSSHPQIITAWLQWNQPFHVGQQLFVFNSDWQAQWNKTPLILQDQMSLGGRYTVRGFDGELTLLGERAWLWRNDLSWQAHQALIPYVALDAGRIMGRSADEQLGRQLIGAAVGIKGQWHGVNYELFVGKPLHKPKGFKTQDYNVGFSVGYQY